MVKLAAVVPFPKAPVSEPVFRRGEYSSIVGVPIIGPGEMPIATVLPRREYRDAVLFADRIVLSLNASMGNSWPQPISVKERVPAQPDADTLDDYLCFIDSPQQTGWMALEWDGKDFLLDAAEPITERVTHWTVLPPDPPKVKR